LQVPSQYEFNPVKCVVCHRPNSPAASLCLWCGALLDSKTALAHFPTTVVELDYLSGIDRLDNAMPVRLTISATGVEVKEVLPGSRIFLIPAAAIIEARVVDKIERVKVEKRATLLQKLLSESSSAQGPQFMEQITHDYILTIWYRLDERVFTAAFHREDDAGKAMINNVARNINSLVQFKVAQIKTEAELAES
jgi:hypothetical protein